ncbi:MAG: hypothetical protein ACI9LE_001071, partial [Paraglaciecola sp.]
FMHLCHKPRDRRVMWLHITQHTHKMNIGFTGLGNTPATD